jgi:Holliday junction DNA helicase RuvA
MIASLRGTVSEKHGDTVIVDCAGVGYGVLVTAADNGGLPTGQTAKLYIYEQIKEDAHDLYGFRTLDGKQLFEQLISVKNVGPKVAMSVLNIGTSDDVRTAIASGDIKRLQTAKGVGKRAAEQMVVELRDKIGAPASNLAQDIVSRGGVNISDEAVQALISLGYSDSDATLALKHVDPSLSVEDRIKAALKGVH